MPDHEELQNDIPEYLASRLEREARQRLERHLRECEACAERVRTGRGLVSAMRAGGEEIFSPHPSEVALRAYALGERTAERAAIARHLATCATCELEVSAWKFREEASRRGLAAAAPRAAEPRASRHRIHPLSLAAGLLVGVGVAVLARLGLPPELPAPPTAAPAAEWSGAAPLFVLESPLRGAEGPATYPIEGDAPYVLLAVQPALPEGAPDASVYRFAILDAGSHAAWSADLTASRIRRLLETSQVVTLPVPSRDLAAGRYALRVTAASEPGAPPLLEIPFEISR